MGSQVCKHQAKPLEAGTQRRIIIGISYYKWSLHNIGTYIHMDMAIVVYECGRRGKCVYKFTYTYTSHELDKWNCRRKMKIGIWATLCVHE